MHLSTILLIGLFLLCCTHNLDGLIKRFSFDRGRVAALCVLLLVLSPFDFDLDAGFSLHPASLILAVLALLAAGREKECYSLPLSAFAAGAAGWLALRAFPDFPEPGALLALPAALLGRLLYRRPRTGLGMLMLFPLMYELCVMLEDWYLFGFASMALGDALQFDAQLAAVFLYGLLNMLPLPARRRTLQKDA